MADEDEDMVYVSEKTLCYILISVIRSFEGIVPPHFYGEMSKTELGCQVLQEKGHFSEFSQFIRQHSHEDLDAEIIMKLKSILWAVVSWVCEHIMNTMLRAL
jgi:hypothetical protein